MTCVSGFAQYTTTDYMYTDGIKEVSGKLCFDVCMKGSEMYYTSFQAEIQLPEGLKVSAKRGGAPNIELLSDSPVFNDDEGFTEHTLSTNFPETGNQTWVRLGCHSSGNYNMAQTSGPLFRVYVEKTEATWPIGAVQYSGAKFITDEAIGYAIADRSDIVLVKSGEVSLLLNVNSSNKWSTCVLPFSTSLPDGVEAYTCLKKENDKVYLASSSALEAYTPYILYSENGFAGTVTGTVTEANLPEDGFVCSDGLLNGAIVPQAISSGYVLQNLDEGVKFYNCDGQTFNIPAGKCWLSADDAEARSISFEIVDPAGIDEITTVSTDNSVYTLDGKKVVNPQPNTIYIIGGKKFIKK